MSSISFCCFHKLKNVQNFYNFKYAEKCIYATFFRANQTKSTNEETSDDINDFPTAEDIAMEEEIERKRLKHRLPARVYSIHVQKNVPDIKLKYEFRKKMLLRHYGHFGNATGLNPGILWPTKQELKDIKTFESQTEPSLQERVQKVQTAKEELEQHKKEYEEQVDQNMIKHSKVVEEYYAKIAKKQATAEALRKKRELLIEEISEYLGYDVDPHDPKFKEAVESREKEKKKAQKAKKEKESYAKMLERLSEMAENPNK